jgi:uncharacterized membrane protein YozB (DUF420 family)
MSTASVTVEGVSRFKPQYLLFGLFGLMVVYVLFHNEGFLVNLRAPVWQHYQPFKWWLLPHGIAGACALVLGPMQFSDRLRQRYAKLHRVAGRFYVAGAFIAGPLGIYIQVIQHRMGVPLSFTMVAATHGTLWMLTTGIAFAFILKRKIQQHRQWMTRSFFVGPGIFLGARVILGVTGLENMGPAAVETVIWMCLAFSIPLADVVLQVQEQQRSRPVARAAKAVAA